MAIKIGVISDTHNLLREEVKERLSGCVRILHAGDVCRPEILRELGTVAPVSAVRGNNDGIWAGRLPETLRTECAGVRIFMIHEKEKIRGRAEDADIVIYGHSHVYSEKRDGGRLWLNPGSCGPKRFLQPVTMALLSVGEDGSFEVERIELSADRSPSMPEEADRRKLVEAVIRAVKAGKPADRAAAKYGASKELADHICRLYLTHPGIDVQGVLDKMELGRR